MQEQQHNLRQALGMGITTWKPTEASEPMLKTNAEPMLKPIPLED